MENLLDLSKRLLDTGDPSIEVHNLKRQINELGDGVAMVDSFSHSVVFDSGEGLVAFDASLPQDGETVVSAIRGWSSNPFDSLVYTHGHVDHVGGSGSFLADAKSTRRPLRVVGHEKVSERFARYRLTSGHNKVINQRQFGSTRIMTKPEEETGQGKRERSSFLPETAVEPTLSFSERTTLTSGDLTFDLRHARGETDDHLWAWVKEKKAICVGDFVIWSFPNCGNPQKVQRYAGEWAKALREMVALEPELMLPAHGLPVAGKERIATMLGTIAGVLEDLEFRVIEMMNRGASLDEIVHSVKVADDLLELPYLRPHYDEPEFVVRNIWRLYGGWWDGDPANLKPSPAADLATELVNLGGIDRFVERAIELAADGDFRLACHLIEQASLAEPSNREVHAARLDIYGRRRAAEGSLMAKGIYGGAAKESKLVLDLE